VITRDLLPRLSIGTWPTPVRRLDQASAELGTEVWAKVEESCGAWGGNKVRKLEYILAHAQNRGSKHLVTYGAGTSSWAAAVVLHGKAMGFEVTLGLGGDVPEHYQTLYEKRGVTVHKARSYNLTPLAAAKAVVAAGPKALRLAAGGSDRRGDLGSMSAGAEIADDVERGRLPWPSTIFVPAGTSGTAAGIAVGLGVNGIRVPIVAVRVTPLPLGTSTLVEYHAGLLLRFLKSKGAADVGAAAAPLTGEGRYFKPGYGAPNPASTEAIEMARRDGIELDPTYAAKAFAALVGAARAGRRGPFLLHLTSPGPLPIDP
jgi:D-cysteine desulfhydrase